MHLAVSRIYFSFPVTPNFQRLFYSCDFSCLRMQDEVMSGKSCASHHYIGTCVDNSLFQQKRMKHLQHEAQHWHWRCQHEVDRSLPPNSSDCRRNQWKQTREERLCSVSGAWLTHEITMGDGLDCWGEVPPLGRSSRVNIGPGA